MRNVTRFGSILLLLASATLGAAQEKIEWLRSAEEAAELAQSQNLPILVYVRSASCHFCDLLQRDVWQDPEIVARIKREFVPLKLTREENAEAVEVMQVKGFPSTIIFTSERRFAHRVDGYLKPSKFNAELDKAQRTAVAARPTQRK